MSTNYDPKSAREWDEEDPEPTKFKPYVPPPKTIFGVPQKPKPLTKKELKKLGETGEPY